MPAIIFLAAVSSLASAEGLQWAWIQPEPVKYHVEAYVNTPRGAMLRAAANLEARALTIAISGDVTCAGTPQGKSTRLLCSMDSMKVEGKAFDGEQGRLDKIFASYSEALDGAELQIRVRADGHIASLDLEGIETSIAQSRDAEEHMRQLMRKTMAPLAIQMPKDAAGAKPWKHKGMPLFYELLTNSGTTGGVMHKYKVDGTAKSGGTFVVGEGRGNLNSQNATQGATTAGAFNMVGASQTRFDPKTGLALYSEVSVTGTPSAANDTVFGGVRYALAAWAGLVREDGTIEGLDGPKAP